MSIRDKLKKLTVPKAYQRKFNSHFAVVKFIAEYETTESQLEYWLAWEVQNENRPEVVRRLHQRYCKLRSAREREELV